MCLFLKKIAIAALLPLALISTVRAAGYVRFEVAGGSVIAPGQTITIYLMSDCVCSGWDIDAVAEVDASGNQTTTRQAESVSNLRADPCNVAYEQVHRQGHISDYQGALFSGYNGWFVSTVPAGCPIISFDYTIKSSWDGSPITIAPMAKGKIYTYAPSADIAPLPDGDKIVNLLDFAMIAQNYKVSPPAFGDISGDGFVDLIDISILAEQWLTCSSYTVDNSVAYINGYGTKVIQGVTISAN